MHRDCQEQLHNGDGSGSALAQAIARFMNETRARFGPNEAHMYVPHISMTGFFDLPPSVAEKEVEQFLSARLDAASSVTATHIYRPPGSNVLLLACRASSELHDLVGSLRDHFSGRFQVRAKRIDHLSLAYGGKFVDHAPSPTEVEVMEQLARQLIDGISAAEWDIVLCAPDRSSALSMKTPAIEPHLIALGGASASGKSTLAHNLSVVLTQAGATVFILRQDAFFKAAEEVPVDPETGKQNWELPTSLNFDAFCATVRDVRSAATVDALHALWDERKLGQDGQDTSSRFSSDLTWLLQGPLDRRQSPHNRAEDALDALHVLSGKVIVLVDGYLLYHDLGNVAQMFDARVFAWAAYETCKRRREERLGYACSDGVFWSDPEGYFDEFVWPAYQQMNRSVLSKLDEAALQSQGAVWVQALEVLSDKSGTVNGTFTLPVCVVNSDGCRDVDHQQQYMRTLVWDTVDAILKSIRP
ncbi:ribosylnicotinamide kinase [Sorochytrium milnesiophthora]